MFLGLNFSVSGVRVRDLEVVTVGWSCCLRLSVDEWQGATVLKLGTLDSLRDSVSCSAVTQEKKGDLTAQGSQKGGPETVLHELPGDGQLG